MIAVIVPTIRPEKMEGFRKAWQPLFKKHNVRLIVVWDGEDPHVEDTWIGTNLKNNAEEILGKDADLIYNFHSGVRNLGFAYVAKFLPEVEVLISLDDDTVPIGDPIADHLQTLEKHFPISWFSTASEYTRGFPYGVRVEAECVFSHGIWFGVPDFDAPTQLVQGVHEIDFYKGAIPKGVYAPICGMNIAFKRKILPYVYFAPNSHNVGRFDDIFMGINLKKICDEKGWAIATGFAQVQHDRASNVFKNLQRESLGIELNETYWQGDESHPYFKVYKEKHKRWKEFIGE